MGNVEKVDRPADDLIVLPSRRGINPDDPEFDPEDFLDKLCEVAMNIQQEKLREILGRNAGVEYHPTNKYKYSPANARPKVPVELPVKATPQ